MVRLVVGWVARQMGGMVDQNGGVMVGSWMDKWIAV